MQLLALDAQPLILLSSEFATRESRLIVIAAFIGSNQTCGWRPTPSRAVLSVIRSTTLATLLPAAIAGQFDDVVAIELRPALLQRTGLFIAAAGRLAERRSARIHHPGPRERDND